VRCKITNITGSCLYFSFCVRLMFLMDLWFLLMCFLFFFFQISFNSSRGEIAPGFGSNTSRVMQSVTEIFETWNGSGFERNSGSKLIIAYGLRLQTDQTQCQGRSWGEATGILFSKRTQFPMSQFGKNGVVSNHPSQFELGPGQECQSTETSNDVEKNLPRKRTSGGVLYGRTEKEVL